MPRAGWVAVLLLAMGSEVPAAGQPPAPIAPVGGPPRETNSTPVARTQSPPPVLGVPVDSTEVTPAAYVDTPAAPKRERAATLGVPTAASSIAIEAPAVSPTTPIPASVVENALAQAAYHPAETDSGNDFLTKRSDLRERTAASSPGGFSKFNLSTSRLEEPGGWYEELIGQQNGGLFRSDHLFDGFISPVTNPFLFEDPRRSRRCGRSSFINRFRRRRRTSTAAA